MVIRGHKATRRHQHATGRGTRLNSNTAPVDIAGNARAGAAGGRAKCGRQRRIALPRIASAARASAAAIRSNSRRRAAASVSIVK
jgi:hypothetical protein